MAALASAGFRRLRLRLVVGPGRLGRGPHADHEAVLGRVIRPATLTGGVTAPPPPPACPAEAAGEGGPPRPPAGAANLGTTTPGSFARPSTDAFTSAGTSLRPAICLPISAILALSGVIAPDTWLATRCNSCISIAMSNSFFRSIADKRHLRIGHDLQRLGLHRLAVDDERDGVGAGQDERTGVAGGRSAEPAAAAPSR